MNEGMQGSHGMNDFVNRDITLEACCRETIDRHSAFNNMIVCSQCKQILKCFDDVKAFNNYLTFCISRRREIATSQYKNFYIISFKSYDSN